MDYTGPALALWFALLTVVVGLYIGISTYARKGFLESYIERDPVANFWRKRLGTTRMITLCRYVLAPLGIVISLGTAALLAWPYVHTPSYAPADDVLPMASFEEGVRALRDIGLLSELDYVAESDVRAYFEQHPLAANLGTQYLERDRVAEPMLLAFDHTRVWWSDGDRAVHPGNHMYETILYEWAAVSDGAFEPFHVVEAWDEEAGVATVTVELEDESVHELTAHYQNGRVDVHMLGAVNELISAYGTAYYVYEPYDDTLYVVCLQDAEQQALAARGWKLAKL